MFFVFFAGAICDEQEGISLKYSYLIETGQKIWDAAKTQRKGVQFIDIEPERAVYYGWLSEQEDKNKPLKTYEECSRINRKIG